MLNINNDFSTTVSGKWILAGEHAVVRGGPAILFPLKAYQLSLSFLSGSSPFSLHLDGLLNYQHQKTIEHLLHYALTLLKQAKLPEGKLTITNLIPISSGLGASAALCTALTEWFIHLGWVSTNKLIDFARQLEDLFHGESSGADIAVTASRRPIYFVRNKLIESFVPSWQPKWYLSHSGQVSSTADCLKKVAHLFQTHPEKAQHADELMKSSVLMAKHALTLNSQVGLPLLKEAIEQSCSAFNQWGLVNTQLNLTMSSLMKAGALATKPTGSGDGGYILSLWPHQAKPQNVNEFIPL